VEFIASAGRGLGAVDVSQATLNYHWTKPDPGADNDVWGDEINATLDGIDATVYAIQTGEAAAAPVQSVAGKTGAVTLVHSDLTDWTASLAPYYLASNPAGYITSAAAPVQSVAGKTGAVTLTHTDIIDWAANVYPLSNPAGYISDAPNDGTAYTRHSASWMHLTHSDITDWAASISQPSSSAPLMNGAAAVGSSGLFARGDHVHPSDTTRLAVQGTATNDNAVAGAIGEVINSNVVSPVTLTTNVVSNITSIALTPGDWDVSGEVWIAIGATVTNAAVALGPTSAVLPASPSLAAAKAQIIASVTGNWAAGLKTCRVSLSGPATYYLMAIAVFASGTTTATGNLWARRAR
jgi:Cu/Ag efflux protein CusF